MDIAVVTAIYGDYDPIPPLPPGFPCDGDTGGVFPAPPAVSDAVTTAPPPPPPPPEPPEFAPVV